ncbi:MAG: S41 family peptidase [Bacteroidales bacterium]|nr:S41 family peptidase [Bacteroidales bacterium]MCF8376997.1 S41 family peptidase [Bacteroidales bacterium]MCF8400850.1 S41 family peptidase [Bacteroidales bacterium]
MIGKLQKGFVLLFMVLLVITSTQSANAQSDPNKSLKKFIATVQYIRYAYVDSVNEPEIIENAIVETLKELDPHSSYIPADEVKKANEPLQGSFEGIGVTFQIYKDTIRVIAPIPGGPSESVGVMAGDKIVKIDGEVATGDDINNQFVFDHLRGKKGTEVDITVYRTSTDNMIDFTIVRDKIPINSIDASFMATPEIGFIKVTRFSLSTVDEFREKLAELKAKGMKKLILDLRGNPGGYMLPGIELADEFIKEDRLLLYTEGLRSPVQKFHSDPGGDFEEGNLVILINEGSASSSEIVAGAVQDLDRGLIIGRRSFGKGLVQKPFQLPDGSIIRLTTARYHTPTGRCIQKSYEEGVDEYYMDIYKRLKHGELVNPDSISFPDSLKYRTPNDRLVYGGGGIMPDIFVPWDSSEVTDYFVDLIRKGIVNSYVMDYVDENRSDILTAYPELEDFVENFRVNQSMFDALVAEAGEKDVTTDQEELEKSKEIILYRVKALIARNIWDVSAFYQVISQIDDEFLMAIEVLNNPEKFQKLTKK